VIGARLAIVWQHFASKQPPPIAREDFGADFYLAMAQKRDWRKNGTDLFFPRCRTPRWLNNVRASSINGGGLMLGKLGNGSHRPENKKGG